MDVALLAEGVDRNLVVRKGQGEQVRSPSSRRAWIEICNDNARKNRSRVALLAEGVDRNYPTERWSISRASVALLAEGVDRNAILLSAQLERIVALLAEGVDRNSRYILISPLSASRPPRGGRG